MHGLPEITDVQRFTYSPGDQFIVRVPDVYDMQECDDIARRFRAVMRLPADVPVCVIPDDMDIEIVSPA